MVNDWFAEWALYHWRLNRHEHLPHPTAQLKEAAVYYKHWQEAFESKMVARDEAREASEFMATEGGLYPSEMLGFLLRRIEARRTDARIQAEIEIRSRDAKLHQWKLSARERLRTLWEELPEEKKEAIRAQVRSEFPEFDGLEKWFERLCLEKFEKEQTKDSQ